MNKIEKEYGIFISGSISNDDLTKKIELFLKELESDE